MKIQSKTSSGFIAGRFQGEKIEKLANDIAFTTDFANGAEYEKGYSNGYNRLETLSPEQIGFKKINLDDYRILGLIEGIDARDFDEWILLGIKFITQKMKGILINKIVQKIYYYIGKVGEFIDKILQWIGIKINIIGDIIAFIINKIFHTSGFGEKIGEFIVTLIKMTFSELAAQLFFGNINFAFAITGVAYKLLEELGFTFDQKNDKEKNNENGISYSKFSTSIFDNLALNIINQKTYGNFRGILGEVILLKLWNVAKNGGKELINYKGIIFKLNNRGIPNYRINYFCDKINEIFTNLINEVKEITQRQNETLSLQPVQNHNAENAEISHNQSNQIEKKFSVSENPKSNNQLKERNISSNLSPITLATMNTISSPRTESPKSSESEKIYSEIEEDFKIDQEKLEKTLQDEFNKSKDAQQNVENRKKIRAIRGALEKGQTFTPSNLTNNKISIGSNIRTISDYSKSEDNDEDDSSDQFKPFIMNRKPEKINRNAKFIIDTTERLGEYSTLSEQNAQIHDKNNLQMKIDANKIYSLISNKPEEKSQSKRTDPNIQYQIQEKPLTDPSIFEEIKNPKKINQRDLNNSNQNILSNSKEKNVLTNDRRVDGKQDSSNKKNNETLYHARTEKNLLLYESKNESKFTPVNHLQTKEKKSNQNTLKINDQNYPLSSLPVPKETITNDLILKRLLSMNYIELITENDLPGIKKIIFLTEELLSFIFISSELNSRQEESQKYLVKLLNNALSLQVVNKFESKMLSIFNCKCNCTKILTFVAKKLNFINLANIVQAISFIHNEENSELLTYYYLNALKGDFASFINYLKEKAESFKVKFTSLSEIINAPENS